MLTPLQECYSCFKSYFPYEMSKCFVDSINHIDDDITYVMTPPVTMLMIACTKGYYKIVERCIKLGANLECTDYFNRTALYYSINTQERVIMEMLLKAGANPNIKIKDVPFIFVVSQSFNLKRVKMLIYYGALINEFYKYHDMLHNNVYCYFIKLLAKRHWVKLKCVALTLSLHKRAVERVNHPDRLLQQGVFEI